MPQPLLLFRSNLQIILQTDRLPVKVKVRKFRVLLQIGNQRIEHIHKAHPEQLKGQIPFAIPMRVGKNITDRFFHDGTSCRIHITKRIQIQAHMQKMS